MDVKHIHGALERLAELAYSEACKDLKEVNTGEFGCVIDMVKDLAEAEYYARISCAMKEAEEDEKEEAKYIMNRMKDEYAEESDEMVPHRMGYNRRRYKSGRFAPKGRGMRMGYIPPEMQDPYLDGGMDEWSGYVFPRIGYSAGERSGEGRGERAGSEGRSRYGKSYDDYRSARRHYTENPTPENKKMVDDSIDEAWEDVEEMIRKMYGDSEAQDKAKLKQKAMQFVQKL